MRYDGAAMTCDCGGQIHNGIINGRPGRACIACGKDANGGDASVLAAKHGRQTKQLDAVGGRAGASGNKYGAVKTACDCGRVHDSKKEAARCGVLRQRADAGDISNLEHQPRYDLVVNGQKIGRYTGDFRYVENGQITVEDTKSEATRKARDYPLRKKLLRACFGIELREV